MAAREDIELEELIRSAGAGVETEPAEDEGEALDLTTLLTVARKSLPWVLLLILLGLTASWLFLRYTLPLYESSSVLQIEEKTEAGALGLSGLGAVVDKQNINKLSGEVELIKSDLIYRRLKDSLTLDVNYYAEGTVLEQELYQNSPFEVAYQVKDGSLFNTKFNLEFLDAQRFRLTYPLAEQEVSSEYRFGQPIRTPSFVLTVTKTSLFKPADLDGKYHFVINDGGAINAYLNANLSVAIVNPDANTIGISFTDHNRLKAHDIVNKVDTVYLVEKLVKKREQAANTLRFLDKQLDKNEVGLTQAEADLQDFARRNKFADVKSQAATIATRMEALEEKRQTVQEEANMLANIAQLVEQERLTDREDGDIAQTIPALSQLKDPLLVQLITQLNDQQLDMQRTLESYQANATTAIKLKRLNIDFTRKSIRQLLEKDQQLVVKQLAKMASQQQAIAAGLDDLPQKATEQERLQRPLDLLKATNLMLMGKKADFEMAIAGTTPNFQILSPASLPGVPISPVKLMVYAVGLAVGIMLGVALIGVRYLMHNTVTSLRELERNTSVPVLGVIPTYDKEKMAVSRLVVDKNPKSAISEAIRSIRTNLEFISSAKVKKKRLISITSTVSGEGKTFVAVNLAAIIAASDQRVVILDLDMRKPKVNLAFDAENVRGISTILIERHTWEECVQRTSLPTLDFISAGPVPPNPSELILNPKFDELLAELYVHYDVVMIDTPPVGLVTDGILIMRKADVPIYIVRANYSKKAFLKNINKLVRINGFTKLTTILNDATSGGGYGYGYGYSYGQGYYDEPPVRKSLVGRLWSRIT